MGVKKKSFKARQKHRPITKKHTKSKSKPSARPPQNVSNDDTDESESDMGEDLLNMVDTNDLSYMEAAIHDNSYAVLQNIKVNKTTNNARKRKKDKGDDGSDEEDGNLERNYEKMQEFVPKKKVKSLLPIKTKGSIIPQSVEQEDDEEEDEEDEAEEEEEEEEDENDSGLENEFVDFKLDSDEPMSTSQLLARRSQFLQQKKLYIGTLSAQLLEQPEEKVGNLQLLLKVIDDDTPAVYVTIRKLAIVSLLEVFKDILPSYAFKEHDFSTVKLKKDTLKLQKHEVALLQYYKKYLQKLENGFACYRKRGKDVEITQADATIAELCLRSMCDLLVMHPYFNFAPNIAQAVVPLINHRDANVRAIVAEACRTVFKEDKKEEITLKIMRIISQLMKRHSHNVYIEALNVFLSLRIKHVNLDKEKANDIKEKKLLAHKKNLINMSRSEKKRKKNLKELENELLETKAEENKQAKEKNLVEITKLLFGIYFRILKSSNKCPVLSACLEGLAKYAHCINLEFYVDIVNVLDNLLKEKWLGHREKLHCIQTVFAILSGHGEAINIDPTRFYINLYKDLLEVNAGETHTNFPIVLNALTNAILNRRKKITNKRIIGFVKRLSLLSLQLLHNSSIACLAVIKNVMQFNKAIDILIDTESNVGDGVYNPDIEDPEYSGASNSTLFELSLLRKHYHPIVVKYARHIASGIPGTGEGSLPTEYGKCTPDELCEQFDMSEMAFNPSIQIPKKVEPKAIPKPHKFADERFKELCYKRMNLDKSAAGTFYINKSK